jgi:hypothetical protein
MASIGFPYWQDGEMWLGYLDRYPDYMTQGTSLDDLREHLLDLYKGPIHGENSERSAACRAGAGLKRRELIKKIEAQGGVLIRHGGNDWYQTSHHSL